MTVSYNVKNDVDAEYYINHGNIDHKIEKNLVISKTSLLLLLQYDFS